MANGKAGRPKGLPKSGGRKKGVVNKTTQSIRESILAVYENIGGDKNFSKWASQEPTEFYKIFARLIPQDQHVSGNIEIIINKGD